MSQKEKQISTAKRKKSIAVWNRRLAWITLPMLLVSTFAVYAANGGWMPNLLTFGIVTSLVFIVLLFVHSFFSVYLFGFPRFKWQIRVVHIYIGYGVFIFTMLSQTLIGFEPYHNIFYALNWAFIVAHVALSTRFMLKRNIKRQPEPALKFRGEENK